jgi:polyribonucleotide nucleotidyltransferase
VLTEAMESAKAARLQIIEKIVAAIPEPRAKVKDSAPTIITLKIDPDKIGMVIGSGGKTIQKISADTGAEIEIEDDGSVFITGKGDGAVEAKKIIEEITHEYKPGERFMGEVTRIMDFGAFVKISSMDEGMVHISELASFRVDRVADVVKVGDKVPVLVKEVDEKGRINLSIKQADPNFIKPKTAPQAPKPPVS